MKKVTSTICISLLCCMLFMANECGETTQEELDNQVVRDQQLHYGKILPIPFYDYSIPRDVLIQIYNVVTQDARSTYTVVETITGVTKYRGSSVGYGIPADTSLTNPLQYVGYYRSAIVAIEQAEPNGLFSSKNTDGTWILYLDFDGSLAPIYTEHKVTTFPYAVTKDEDGEWKRLDKTPSTVKIELNNN